jgi:RNA polymerase sigma-70 factor, ECF subfamily
MPETVVRSGDARAHDAAEAVARRSYGRLVALLTARTRDVAGAEDALSSAFAAALVAWPASGVPRNPEAWVLAVARRRWIDAARRRRSAERVAGQLRLMAEELHAATEHPDERCALTFVCSHPAIDPGIRAPLILQALFGFDAAAIGSALSVSPAGMSQRLVRTKKRIRKAGLRFEAPGGAELAARREAVREAIEAAFSKVGRPPARRSRGGTLVAGSARARPPRPGVGGRRRHDGGGT